MRAAVIVPTYNERDNIAELVRAIRLLPHPPAVFIIDDNSPDGTGEIADRLAGELPDVYVHHRPAKLGLGTAHVAGFKMALTLGFNLVLTMDADFSHHPQYIPDLLEASRRFDVVIGSRYVGGGGTRSWGLGRRVLSRTANMVARTTLGLDAHDCTAGFRCYHRRVLESIHFEGILSDGYSFLVELLYQVQRQGFRIGEVPILFEDRRQGRSKISRAEILKAVFTVFRLGLERCTGERLSFPERKKSSWGM